MNERTLWFKAKTYGWGWTPASWQGWVVLLCYLAVTFVLVFFCAPEKGEESLNQVVGFAAAVGLPTLILLIICFYKGERPRWRWGEKK